MRVFLTGGAGYAGSHVLKKLREHNIPVMVFDDFSNGHEEFLEGNPFIRGDICDKQGVSNAISDFKPDIIFHVAAMATISECSEFPERCHEVNVNGTRNILDIMCEQHIKHIVFASSCAVYANAETMAPLSETDPLNPLSPYAASKRDAEAVLKEYDEQHNIRSVAFRIFNISGAHPDGNIGERHDPETHLLPLVIDTMLGKRETIYIFGDDYPTPDGTAIRDYVHVWDIAEAFLRAGKLLQTGSPSQILNMGSGLPTSVIELLNNVKSYAQKDINSTLQERREGDTAWLYANTKHLEKTLAWKPEWSNQSDIIKTALKWHENQQ